MSNWIIKNSHAELEEWSIKSILAGHMKMLENHWFISYKLQIQNYLNLDQHVFLLTQKYVLGVVAAEELDACIHK